jgi:hypothetical protein
MPKWLKMLLAPLWLPVAAAAGCALWRQAIAAPAPGLREAVFTGGLAGYFLLVLLTRERGRSFAHTFEHELTHLVAGLIFLQKPSKFRVGQHTGETELTGSNWFISLAPYFLPLWALLPLLLLPLLNPGGTLIALGALGFLYGLHLYSTLYEFGFYQTDVTEHGRIFSLFCVIALNALVLGLVCAAVTGGWPGIREYCLIFAQCVRAGSVWCSQRLFGSP